MCEGYQIPCTRCIDSRFCSEECLLEAESSYHPYECQHTTKNTTKTCEPNLSNVVFSQFIRSSTFASSIYSWCNLTSVIEGSMRLIASNSIPPSLIEITFSLMHMLMVVFKQLKQKSQCGDRSTHNTIPSFFMALTSCSKWPSIASRRCA